MKNLLLFAFIFTVIGCKSTSQLDRNVAQQDANSDTLSKRAYSMQTVLWQQNAAEYKALCHQAFNTAKMQLDQIVADGIPEGKSLAIISDIDETLLDNSPYNAKMIETDKEYSKEDWITWGALQKAQAVPGAVDFAQYAEYRGFKMFYLSNRYDVQRAETIQNLKNVGFPSVHNDRVLLRTTSSGKESRRQTVAADHEIVMLIGDNLSDFNDVFDKKSTQERNTLVESLQKEFGTRYIVLPNPMYGDWESKGIYEGSYDWTTAQKDSLRRHKLISY